MMRRRIEAIVNAGSGGGNDAALVERLERLLRRDDTEVRIHLADSGEALARLAEDAVARRVDVIVAGGGDGTVGAVAAAVAGTGIALGVLPLGTFNHFAKDLGVPLDLEQAAALVLDGEPGKVDLGEVNGKVFVNNSSLGLYPDIVRDRERQQRRLGRGKWPALLWASLAALRRFPFLNVRLAIDGEPRLFRTAFVFVGNNAYRMEGFAIGERARLDGGRLSLYAAQRHGRFRLLLLSLRALAGRLRQARDFEAVLATEIVVESRHRHLHVATDGEISVMTPPLRYRIRPASLAVLRPAAATAAAA
jgi:diacylglycerol kinase family enzyme